MMSTFLSWVNAGRKRAAKLKAREAQLKEEERAAAAATLELLEPSRRSGFQELYSTFDKNRLRERPVEIGDVTSKENNLTTFEITDIKAGRAKIEVDGDTGWVVSGGLGGEPWFISFRNGTTIKITFEPENS